MLKCLPDIYWRIILWEDMLCFCQTRLKPIDILQAAGYHLWRWSLAGLSLFPLRVKNTVTFARHVKHLPFAPYLVSISNICGIWSKNQSNLSYFTVFAWELCFFHCHKHEDVIGSKLDGDLSSQEYLAQTKLRAQYFIFSCQVSGFWTTKSIHRLVKQAFCLSLI